MVFYLSLRVELYWSRNLAICIWRDPAALFLNMLYTLWITCSTAPHAGCYNRRSLWHVKLCIKKYKYSELDWMEAHCLKVPHLVVPYLVKAILQLQLFFLQTWMQKQKTKLLTALNLCQKLPGQVAPWMFPFKGSMQPGQMFSWQWLWCLLDRHELVSL